MYSIDWPAILRLPRKAREGAGARAESPVSGVVWSLGFTSLLTDISSEMVSSILPIYLVLYLRMSPLAFGAVDGIYQGLAALLRLAAGFVGDYSRQHKLVATSGYALSAICRVGLIAAGNSWVAIASIVALDRTGKGIRTAPRDALISLSTAPAALARAFGVHRALDAAGAMLGPLLAFLILAWMPTAFDVIFVVSFCVAIIGVGVIGFFVRPPDTSSTTVQQDRPSLKDAMNLWKGTIFRPLLIATGLLSLATISDAFVFLTLQRQVEFSAGLFPLLFVGVSLTNFALAAPTGRLADRHGRLYVFLGGHALLLVLYALLLVPQASVVRVIACLVVLGAYYAATDGVLAAMAASVLPRELCGSGLALLATATNVGRLLSSIAFGVLWNSGGLTLATVVFVVALATALVCAVSLLRRGLPRGESLA